MSTHPLPDDLEALLLEYQMDLLDADERDRIEQALGRDLSLQAKQRRLAKTLDPLSAWRPPAMPPNLAASVMARIKTHDETIALDPAHAEQPVGTESATMSALMSLREIIAVAAAILIIVGVFVPSYYGITDRSEQPYHGAGSIFQGMTSYVDDARRAVPNPVGTPGASWLQAPSPGDGRLVGKRHPYLRVKFHSNPKLIVVPTQPEDIDTPPDQYEGLDEVVAPNFVSYRWHIQLDPVLRSMPDGRANSAANLAFSGLQAVLAPLDELLAGPSLVGILHGPNVLGVDDHTVWQWAARQIKNKDNHWPPETLDRDPTLDAEPPTGVHLLGE